MKMHLKNQLNIHMSFKAKRLIAIALTILFVCSFGMYVINGINSMDEKNQIVMTGFDKEASKADENAPSLTEMVRSTTTHYTASLIFLLICYCILSAMNIRRHMTMQCFLSALFILFSIGLSYKALFPSFTGLSGEAVFTCLGGITAIIVAIVWKRMHHQLSDKMFKLLVIAAGLLLALHIFAPSSKGANAWLNVAGISIQLSEPLKVILILLGACSFRNTFRSIVYCILCLCSAAVMVLIHDLGTALVFLAVFVLMSYLLFDNRVLSLSIVAVGCLCFAGFITINPYAMSRLLNWGNAMTNTEIFQQRDFIIMCIAGGWKGLGFEGARHFTDIFAAGNDAALAGVMAVFGLGTAIVTIGCYAVLILTAAYHHSVVKSNHLILFQVATVIFVQVLLNYAGALDLIPFTGINAPFVSSGGSSTLTMGALFGLMAGAFYPTVKNLTLEFLGGSDNA